MTRDERGSRKLRVKKERNGIRALNEVELYASSVMTQNRRIIDSRHVYTSRVRRSWGNFGKKTARKIMMGQFNATPSSPRVMFDEESDNGLVLCDKYLPKEMLMEILCHADCKTLLNCQLVCKHWNRLMNKVWHMKTEQTLGKPFPWNDRIPWSVYYFACTKKPYERNLIKNHSGAYGLADWKLLLNGGDRWKVEEPPVGVQELQEMADPMFENRQICFTTSFQRCNKEQKIDLTREGIHPYILDTYRPPIVVSEWYSCRWDCPAVYELGVELLGIDNELIDEFVFKDILIGEKQNEWLKVSHVFENYGPGLRIISFEHGGKDRSYWAGHYGSKMTRACVFVKIPGNISTVTSKCK